MTTTGITLSLDLHECRSPALGNAELLEQVVVSALQFAGLDVREQLSQRLPGYGVLVLCILGDGYAALHALDSAAVVADVTLSGTPEAARAALEIVRGFLAQKLIARAVTARVVERGSAASAP